MKVVVGSMNHAKVEAVRKAFSLYFENVEVIPVYAESGVSEMPFHDEVAKGGNARAKKAYSMVKADYAVGLEGGLVHLHGNDYICNYVAITDGKRTHGAYGMLWECPPKVFEQMKAGKSLGDLIDGFTGRKNTNQAEGASGYFTKGRLTREESFVKTTISALIPFISKEHY